MAESNEIKYSERLNISEATISKAKGLIKTNIINTMKCWDKGINIEKQTFHIIGPAGVGKSQISEQIPIELTAETGKQFEKIMVKCPVLSRDDFIIPFPVMSGDKTSFKMLYSNFVPMKEDSYGIFIIDEFSRGDHALQQLMWQIQNDYKVHLRDLPKGWFVIAIDNPDDSEYNMNTLEDAAGLRRMLHLYVDVNTDDFLKHAIKNNYHPLVIEFIQSHPEFIYDFQAQKIGSVYANPASYERLSNVLIGYENSGGIDKNLNNIEILSSGLLNVAKTRLFMDYLKEQSIIKPKDIFYNYDKIRGKIRKLAENKNNAKLGELVVAFTTYLTSSKPDYTIKELKNIAEFLTTIPLDTAAIFVSQIDNFPKQSEEFRYIGIMHAKLMDKSKLYKETFYDELMRVNNSNK